MMQWSETNKLDVDLFFVGRIFPFWMQTPFSECRNNAKASKDFT